MEEVTLPLTTGQWLQKRLGSAAARVRMMHHSVGPKLFRLEHLAQQFLGQYVLVFRRTPELQRQCPGVTDPTSNPANLLLSSQKWNHYRIWWDRLMLDSLEGKFKGLVTSKWAAIALEKLPGERKRCLQGGDKVDYPIGRQLELLCCWRRHPHHSAAVAAPCVRRALMSLGFPPAANEDRADSVSWVCYEPHHPWLSLLFLDVCCNQSDKTKNKCLWL